MKGRALVDLPQYRLRCGDYGEIPDKEAVALIEIGSFDPQAVSSALPGETAIEQPPEKRKKK